MQVTACKELPNYDKLYSVIAKIRRVQVFMAHSV